MLTIENLKEFGANTSEGVARCFGNAEFYLKLVKTVPDEKKFDELKEAIEAGNLDLAFEHAHALKGVLTNLALSPIADPAVEITDLLRQRTQMDYTPILDKMLSKKDELAGLCG